MGLSSKKQKQTTNQTQTATTAPVVSSWMEAPLKDYAGNVTSFLGTDPQQYVAGPSDLQEQAFAAAANLGGGNPELTAALDAAKAAGAAPASSAGVSTYSAPTLGGPAQVNLGGYDAPRLGAAAQAGEVSLAPTAHANSESLLAGFDKYLDPSMQFLVDAALRNYDAQTGRNAAALKAEQARTGAFGGSRAGIARGEFAAASDRGRALTEGELRARAFSQAAQMADSDAGRRQQTGLFNAGSDNTRGLTQGQMDLQRLLANIDSLNRFTLTQGGLDEGAARFGAEARNTGSMFNAGAMNEFDLAQAGLDASAGQFNTSAANRNAEFNATQEEVALQRALEAAGLTANIGTTGAANERADIGLVADLGEIERLIEQAQLGAPLAQLQAAGQLYGIIPAGSYLGSNTTGTTQGTTTTKSTGSLFDAALAAASVAAMASDRRLKENIERVGEFPDGLGIYEFDYRQDTEAALPAGRFRGVMADEVEKLRPWALGPILPGGFASVNYRALEGVSA